MKTPTFVTFFGIQQSFLLCSLSIFFSISAFGTIESGSIDEDSSSVPKIVSLSQAKQQSVNRKQPKQVFVQAVPPSFSQTPSSPALAQVAPPAQPAPAAAPAAAVAAPAVVATPGATATATPSTTIQELAQKLLAGK